MYRKSGDVAPSSSNNSRVIVLEADIFRRGLLFGIGACYVAMGCQVLRSASTTAPAKFVFEMEKGWPLWGFFAKRSILQESESYRSGGAPIEEKEA